jgi:hypothetical protein
VGGYAHLTNHGGISNKTNKLKTDGNKTGNLELIAMNVPSG